MKNEFVPYEQALELKELGFGEPCFGYGDSDSSYIDTPSSIEKRMINPFNKTIKIPTFSQAFRFFREKYKLIHQIYSLKYKGGVNYDYEIFSLVPPTDDELGNEDDVATDKSMETYDSLVDKNFKHDEHETYEESELACLIKLIEIVKTKNI